MQYVCKAKHPCYYAIRDLDGDTFLCGNDSIGCANKEVCHDIIWHKTGDVPSAKDDGGKAEIDLVPMQIVRDIAQVRMYGNQKYGDPENWKSVELRRYVNALLRHTLAFAENVNAVDEESGIAHYKHMACNLAFICEMMKEDTAFEKEEKKHE